MGGIQDQLERVLAAAQAISREHPGLTWGELRATHADPARREEAARILQPLAEATVPSLARAHDLIVTTTEAILQLDARLFPAASLATAFLGNHLACSLTTDDFIVITLGFQVLSVFLVFDHARRKVLRFAVISDPTVDWVTQQLREATLLGQQPRCLLRDDDQICGQGVRTAYRSSWQSP